MTSQKLIDLKLELQTALDDILPRIEGLEDFARLNIADGTKALVTETLVKYAKRRDLLKAALESLGRLETDSYPDTPQIFIPEEAYQDLKENVATIAAAFEKFLSSKSINLGITVGAPEPKN